MGHDVVVAASILAGTNLLTLLLAAILNIIHDIYAPDHIWATVVVGVGIIGVMFGLWLWFDPLPSTRLAAFWRLLAVCVVAGGPIIAWQIGQANARPKSRKRNGHGADDARSPADS
jgi:multisubunit Na+/H+ antiporter MnhG subunit